MGPSIRQLIAMMAPSVYELISHNLRLHVLYHVLSMYGAVVRMQDSQS